MATSVVTLSNREYTVRVRNSELLIDGVPAEGSVTAVEEGAYSVLLDGEEFRIVLRGDGHRIEALCSGIPAEVTVETERDRLIRRYTAEAATFTKTARICAPMPALVVKVEVHVGQEVQAGQSLIVLEAMKMENELKAPHGGLVTDIRVRQGKTVEKGELLLVVE